MAGGQNAAQRPPEGPHPLSSGARLRRHGKLLTERGNWDGVYAIGYRSMSRDANRM